MKQESGLERKVAEGLDEIRRNLRYFAQGHFGSLQNLDKAAGWRRGYLSAVVTGQVRLRMEHILVVLSLANVAPSDFFHRLDLMAGRKPDPRPMPRDGMNRLVRMMLGAYRENNEPKANED